LVIRVFAVRSQFHSRRSRTSRRQSENGASRSNHNLYPSICNCCRSDNYSTALSAFEFDLYLILLLLFAAVTQDFQNQEEVGEEDEAEQTHPLLDPHENR